MPNFENDWNAVQTFFGLANKYQVENLTKHKIQEQTYLNNMPSLLTQDRTHPVTTEPRQKTTNRYDQSCNMV